METITRLLRELTLLELLQVPTVLAMAPDLSNCSFSQSTALDQDVIDAFKRSHPLN